MALQIQPASLQPVDEDVSPSDIVELAREADTQVVYYHEAGVWECGEYSRCVLGPYQQLAETPLWAPRMSRLAGMKQSLTRLLGGHSSQPEGRRDHLDSDLLAPASGGAGDQFEVAASEQGIMIARLRAEALPSEWP